MGTIESVLESRTGDVLEYVGTLDSPNRFRKRTVDTSQRNANRGTVRRGLPSQTQRLRAPRRAQRATHTETRVVEMSLNRVVSRINVWYSRAQDPFPRNFEVRVAGGSPRPHPSQNAINAARTVLAASIASAPNERNASRLSGGNAAPFVGRRGARSRVGLKRVLRRARPEVRVGLGVDPRAPLPAAESGRVRRETLRRRLLEKRAPSPFARKRARRAPALQQTRSLSLIFSSCSFLWGRHRRSRVRRPPRRAGRVSISFRDTPHCATCGNAYASLYAWNIAYARRATLFRCDSTPRSRSARCFPRCSRPSRARAGAERFGRGSGEGMRSRAKGPFARTTTTTTTRLARSRICTGFESKSSRHTFAALANRRAKRAPF